MNHRSPTLRVLLLLGTLAITPLGAAAQDLSTASVSTGGAVLALRGDRLAVDLPGGEARRLALPEGVHAEALASGSDGWWLAGTRVQPEGSELLWLGSLDLEARAIAELPAPPAEHALQREPLPLTVGGELIALAWLEGDGDRTLAVRSARREGDGWSTPMVVSPPGPGSQLALSGVALPGGDLLLAWSAFDGDDDEILWSRLSDGVWSPPQPLNGANGVPDVTPALALVEGVPTAVWSRYTPAGYTLYGARWETGGWIETGPVAAPGSLFPAFTQTAAGPVLTYRRAVPRSWVVAEVAAGGGALRQTATTEAARPVPLSADDHGVSLLSTEGGAEATRLAWEKQP